MTNKSRVSLVAMSLTGFLLVGCGGSELDEGMPKDNTGYVPLQLNVNMGEGKKKPVMGASATERKAGEAEVKAAEAKAAQNPAQSQ